MRKKLFQWQHDCLDAWISNSFKGIVNVVTGAGKTVLAMAAIQKLSESEGSHLKVKIVVPKTFLIFQWRNALEDELGVPRDEIGYFYGKHKDNPDRKYMIYVINSARYNFARHIADNFKNGLPVLLIADECHHYCSKENSRIFEFLKSTATNTAAYYSLGLSATPAGRNYAETLVSCIGKEIFRYEMANALNSNIISDFFIYNVALDFTPDEESEYEELSDKIGILLIKIKTAFPHISSLPKNMFFNELSEMLRAESDPEHTDKIASFLFLSQKRASLVKQASARVTCTCSILRHISNDSRVIIFSERIETAERIYKILKKEYPGQAGRYHSNMDEAERKNVLYRYQNSEIRILVSCRALDEGLNIPETDVGIVVSSTSTNRQRIQRLGRILRKSGKNHHARLFYLYVAGSNEPEEFLSDLNGDMPQKRIFDILFNTNTDNFNFPEYEKISRDVLFRLSKESKTPVIIAEMEKSIKAGTLNLDWLLPEQDCHEKIKRATSAGEQNYYIAALHMARQYKKNNLQL